LTCVVVVYSVVCTTSFSGTSREVTIIAASEPPNPRSFQESFHSTNYKPRTRLATNPTTAAPQSTMAMELMTKAACNWDSCLSVNSLPSFSLLSVKERVDKD